ncbi:seminase [Drosophila hydei]|uniref:Seminase n=1 Tax=Drosophila hydei TaxID=7224 RepID=A0A6J1L893_DROHY|nr:seminase [Drosophila hydei]
MALVFVLYFALMQLALSPFTQAEGHAGVEAEAEADAENFPNLKSIVMPLAINRVVGGEAITIQKVGGYILALRYDGDFICGGSLLRDLVVLSAAHCFLGRTDKSLWIVEGGVSRLNEDGVKVQLKDYVVPAAFTEREMNMDVAVVLLSDPLNGPNIATIPLCKTSLVPGLKLTVYGWGLSDPDGTYPHQHLRAVSVPVIKKKDCKNTYRSSITITDSMFCAGVLGKKDACTFDSGGPFVYANSHGGRELCGIVSFGIGCASPKYPGVYTDVNYIKPFILATIKNFGVLD